REASQELEQRYKGELADLGMTVTEPDLAPFREAVRPVIAKWGPTVGEDLVDAAINFEH
ncbi:MAG: TRAP transporter substrate-binding protein, partial [Pseudomonadota bacterium]|nr:TRAP transporter substrate-binding protein [Pseudomonadota bacterium]